MTMLNNVRYPVTPRQCAKAAQLLFLLGFSATVMADPKPGVAVRPTSATEISSSAAMNVEPLAAAAVVSPTPGSKLTGTSMTLTWSAVSGASQYSIYIGTTKGAHDLGFVNAGLKTSATISNLPTKGATFYVVLFSLISGKYQSNSYSYIEAGPAVPAAMTSPTQGSTLTGSSATFKWTPGTFVTLYNLYFGTTKGGHDVSFVGAGTATSVTVNNLPTTGKTLYVTLYSLIDGAYQQNSYTYTTATTAGTLTVTPTSLSLGSVVVGKSGTASGTLKATGASVTVTSATSNNSGVFSVGGLSLPVTIGAGSSVPFTITFSPAATGSASATLSVKSNAQTTTITEALSGTGTAASTHTVNLAWDPSTSPNISGYNVYRAVYGTTCGVFGKINSTLDTTTVFSDSTVTNGASYCYATTAVNSSHVESGYSNVQSGIKIPTT